MLRQVFCVMRPLLLLKLIPPVLALPSISPLFELLVIKPWNTPFVLALEEIFPLLEFLDIIEVLLFSLINPRLVFSAIPCKFVLLNMP